MQIIKGPDFPTGAKILGKAGIEEAYRTGKGKIRVRAVAEIETQPNGKSKIVITELPYLVNKARLIEKMGGDKMTVYGLSHLGDYEATLFSPFSNNRRFGEEFVKGETFGKLAEGVYTVEALMDIAREYHLELPICTLVYAIVHEHKEPKEELLKLFLRDTKTEQE